MRDQSKRQWELSFLLELRSDLSQSFCRVELSRVESLRAFLCVVDTGAAVFVNWQAICCHRHPKAIKADPMSQIFTSTQNASNKQVDRPQ